MWKTERKDGQTAGDQNQEINKQNLSKNRQKVNRYSLYTLETLLALLIVTSLTISIILFLIRRESVLKCKKCGHNLKVNDLFCSKCGEKR